MSAWANGTRQLAAPGERRPLSAPAIPAADRPRAVDASDSALIERLGTVRISRRVLRTVAQQAALSVHGVTRMATVRGSWPQRLGRPLPQHGVSLTVRGSEVAVDLYLVVQPGASMVAVGMGAQEAVKNAVEHILGMDVSEVNVYVQDVA